MKNEEGYYCNLTSFEWFVAEIFGFQPASEFFGLYRR